MKIKVKNIFIFLVCVLLSLNVCIANDLGQADSLLKKAKITKVEDESYDYILKARKIYQEECDENLLNVRALVGLSKTYQMTKDRREAKLYILKAYNLEPDNPKMQKEMGDFFYSFQEYSTAIEYYKLALASGLLTDFETNLQCAKCYEKLGDLENAQLYYKICNHVNTSSQQVSNKLNEYESKKHSEQQQQEPKYKYLYKKKPVTEEQKTEDEANEIIEEINGAY